MKDISFNLEIEPDGKILDKIQIIGRSRRILGNIIDYIAFTIFRYHGWKWKGGSRHI